MAKIIDFNEYKSKRAQQELQEQLGSLMTPWINMFWEMLIRYVYLPLVAAWDTAKNGKLRRYY